MDFTAINYRETPLGMQVWLLTQQLIEEQNQWDELPREAIGTPLVNGMGALSRALEHGYRSGNYCTVAEAYHRAAACAGEVEAALQDAIRHELLAEPMAYRLDREICQIVALLRFLAIQTECPRDGCD